MITLLRTIQYKLYIRYLAFRWIFQINLGDEVIHKGRVRSVNNGVCEGYWTLTNPYEEYVPRSECRKKLSFKNLYGSYKSGVRFYEGYWLSIWVNSGIEPWVRALRIWPRKTA